jgi:DNA-binding MarR family transcriptional regulator
MDDPADDKPRRQLGSEPLRFMQGMWALVHALDVRSKQMYRRIGVTGAQRLVLRIVGSHPMATAGEIAAILEIHASTLSGVLARLEAGGMITRKVDARDRRRAQFRLTAAGKKVDRERKGTVEAAVTRALARASPDMVKGCAEVLRLLVAELERDDR